MLELVTTSTFRKDLKIAKKRGYDLSLIEFVIDELLKENTLPQKYKDHALTGNYKGFRECHILPDWLLIYSIDKSKLILTASRTGTHSDLFS
jgi:addiction module toxin, relE/stbE family